MFLNNAGPPEQSFLGSARQKQFRIKHTDYPFPMTYGRRRLEPSRDVQCCFPAQQALGKLHPSSFQTKIYIDKFLPLIDPFESRYIII